MEREDKRGVFFGVIGVLTLIVAIIGASFAYFSINARSKQNAVNVSAASVKIVYTEGDQIAIENLIPSTREIAMKTLTRGLAGTTHEVEGTQVPYTTCKDDNNYTTCGYYEFSLTNNSENAVKVKAYVVPTALTEGKVGFSNLMFTLYDRTGIDDKSNNGTQVYEGKVPYNAEAGTYDVSGFSLLGSDINTTADLAGKGASKNYRLFFWLNEAGEDNNDEQGAIFKGTIHVDLPGANGDITGVAAGE